MMLVTFIKTLIMQVYVKINPKTFLNKAKLIAAAAHI